MEPIRTDLAVERTAAAPSLPGVTQETRGNAFSVTEIRIKNDVCGAPIGKPAGRYVTLEAPAISRSSANYQEMAEELAAELGKFLPQEGCVFLAGLGNRAITPDALGPRVASKVLATRHLRTALTAEELTYLPELRPVCVLAGGVLGQTGVESGEIVGGLCEVVHPAAVIAIDALASRRCGRVCATVQLSDTGIIPGSGVGNHRAALNRETLGVPVFAIGVPTVVDSATLAADILEESGVEKVDEERLRGEHDAFMVTTRDIDQQVRDLSKVVGYGINWALQDLEIEEMNALLS